MESVLIPALFGLVGVVLGAWLTGRYERKRRQLDFLKAQLQEFYSPLLGLRAGIRSRNELRLKLSQACDRAWRELCKRARASKDGVAALQKLEEERGPEFSRRIDYENRVWREELFPYYEEMLKVFQRNMWLADVDTRIHFSKLVEFVDLWKRWLDHSLPREALELIEQPNLNDFFDHLEKRHDELRAKLSEG